MDFTLDSYNLGDTFSTDIFGGSSYENDTMGDGFTYGPYATSQYDTFAGPPAPDGLVAVQNRSANEFSWFDQSTLRSTFNDILSAGIGAAKVAVDQEIRGSNQNTGMNFFDVLRNSALDRFSSSKTGKEIRSQVLASQIRTFFSNPLYLIVTLAGVAFLMLFIMRK